MAVTVLKHLKESKVGVRSAHLKNAINYICNPAKTQDGDLIYSNCGIDKKEIYESMLQTKEFYNKIWGRQGYHYVISLPPGEGSPELMYQIGKEFCDELLSGFDHVFAVHTDQAHIHCHVVFNSVNRKDGYKYRYNNGDWKKLIQPVTDKLCEKYGLSSLEYLEEEPRIGKDYAEHLAEKEDRLTYADLIRMDIDAAILQSESTDDFFREMQKKGYTYRIGHSEKYGDYVAYHMPGAQKAKRDYTLGEGYSLYDVKRRISMFEVEINSLNDFGSRDTSKNSTSEVEMGVFPYEKLDRIIRRYFPSDTLPVYRMSGLSRYQVCMVSRVHQAIRHYDFDLIISEQSRVRQDLIHIDRLRDECNYLLDKKISSRDDLVKRKHVIAREIKEARSLPEEAWMDKRQELYAERRIVRRLLKEYEETMKTRNLSPARDMRKEMTYGNKDNAKLRPDTIPVPSDIEGPLRDPLRYN